ncbi:MULTISPECIES: carcinine hydrolase/isopenicillin-N N-acyltransferase family protein [unclassified Crossiella]|uniref:carcinine hydrolase/isopenicillin-N N-acyltransferase family protein n=1 Tax=unclassified Crossiella TaxID=2620835 RepID=UPI001FFEEB6E|nr:MULTISPECIES: carcinine hydrolase/isopenicillin-N N-acyltransferase family protein [unclassified Crossiella]MCK2239956.1 carcinine hydrolase/isopenicillin-N N-acyltransferase family protein [Crossiella sp. S99.2]MCK2252664.1 carcinine hydrolase/isopenicillin-N N-acyltransferase family protein [Crossiella sp. S99.1]
MTGDIRCSTTFRAFAEARPGPAWREHVHRHWPRLRATAADHPDAQTWRTTVLSLTSTPLACLAADLAEAAQLPDPDLPGFLTHVNPPGPVVSGAQGTGGASLVRNLDLDLTQHESTLWLSQLGTRRVLGTTAGLWGLLDGMNEDGLAVSLTSGGGHRHTEGLSGPLLVRHLLEHCTTVAAVDEVLGSWPTASTHDLTVIDATGARAGYRLTPGEPTQRGRTRHWPEVSEAIAAMLSRPRHRTGYTTGAGTLHTAVYHPAEGELTLIWPDGVRTWTFGNFTATERLLEYPATPA